MSEKKENGIAYVQGVLKYNEDTRRTMMKRNFWEDKIYTDLAKGLGEYAEIKTAEIRPRYSLDGIANGQYMALMTINSYANQDRHISEKYITPSLSSTYGGNPNISGNIGYWNVWGGNTGVYNHEMGRIPDGLLADDIKIIHDYAQMKDNNGKYYLDRVLKMSLSSDKKEEHIKYDFRSQKYISTSDFDNGREILDISNYSINGFLAGDRLSDKNLRFEYNEGDVADKSDYSQINNENGTDIFLDKKNKDNGLLNKTKELFNNHKISTMIGRFHSSFDNGLNYAKSDIDSAVNPIYGNSKGRNLLKLNAGDDDKTNGYSNPYCRVWTYHHQYDKVSKLIRPFTDGDNNLASILDIQAINKNFRSRAGLLNADVENGEEYLANNTVLNKNGFVNITPSNSGKVDIKNCMFSIENLAWKDVPTNLNYLSKEQQGPNGGRIMWFPPYDLDFQESVNVNWDSNAFIGRGEKVYTYNNTDRTGTLSFSILIDHPSVVNNSRNAMPMGNDNDVDADILRYFAGCQLPDWKQMDVKDDEEENESNIGDIPSQGMPDGTERIKFYVYFPNNFSGNYTEITKEEWEKEGSADLDWYLYLLTGQGTSLVAEEGWRGYEIKEGEGLGDAGDKTFYPNPWTEECTQWKKRKEIYKESGKYNYRTDFDLRQIIGISNYIDNNSYGLNCKLNTEVSKDATCTFGEIMSALLLSQKTDNAKDIRDFLVSNGADKARINKLETLFKNEKISFTSINVKGSATKQDDKNRNGCTMSNAQLLAIRRAKSVCTLFKNGLHINNAKDNEIVETDKLSNMSSVNTLEAKSQRYAVVEIFYNPPKIEKFSETNPYASTNVEDELLKDFCEINSINYEATEYLMSAWDLDFGTDVDGSEKIESDVITLVKFAEECQPNNVKAVLQYLIGEKKVPDLIDKYLKDPDKYATEINELKENINSYILLKNAEAMLAFDENFEDFIEEMDEYINKEEENLFNELMVTLNKEINGSRYETEGEYFSKLDKNSPLVYKSIRDKFKYFNPAFHSISPEGFNARLNFLQQCTRQGHTIEASDSNGYAKTAGNLAFGRMPVCVLRIGDFINTRIIIQSMTINYGQNGMQWDLNPEGAGVQPMYAKISLTITILGGQSLTGPVNRLQNAVSFNYYANTGVYDNRADRVRIEKGENGSIVTKYDYLWSPRPENKN